MKQNMSDFTISLAGIPIGISPLTQKVRRYLSEYITSEPPLFTIVTTEEDIERERAYADKTHADEGIVAGQWNRGYLEKLSLLRNIANKMVEYDVILFHGAAVAVNGKCYLFTAPSGTGKTTHSRLWLERLPQAYILNGDKPFLKVTEEGNVLVCGVPWRGKEGMGRNEILPLEAICVLERSPENWIEPAEPQDVISKLIRQIHVPDGLTASVKVMQLLDRICRKVRLYRLGCNMEPEAADVSIGAMLCEND